MWFGECMCMCVPVVVVQGCPAGQGDDRGRCTGRDAGADAQVEMQQGVRVYVRRGVCPPPHTTHLAPSPCNCATPMPAARHLRQACVCGRKGRMGGGRGGGEAEGGHKEGRLAGCVRCVCVCYGAGVKRGQRAPRAGTRLSVPTDDRASSPPFPPKRVRVRVRAHARTRPHPCPSLCVSQPAEAAAGLPGHDGRCVLVHKHPDGLGAVLPCHGRDAPGRLCAHRALGLLPHDHAWGDAGRGMQPAGARGARRGGHGGHGWVGRVGKGGGRRWAWGAGHAKPSGWGLQPGGARRMVAVS